MKKIDNLMDWFGNRGVCFQKSCIKKWATDDTFIYLIPNNQKMIRNDREDLTTEKNGNVLRIPWRSMWCEVEDEIDMLRLPIEIQHKLATKDEE